MNRNECVVISGNRRLYSVFYQIIVQIWHSELKSEQWLMIGNKASTATAQNKTLKVNRKWTVSVWSTVSEVWMTSCKLLLQ